MVACRRRGLLKNKIKTCPWLAPYIYKICIVAGYHRIEDIPVEKGNDVKESHNSEAAHRSTCQMSALTVTVGCNDESAACQQLLAKEASIMELGARRYIGNCIIASKAVMRSMSQVAAVPQ